VARKTAGKPGRATEHEVLAGIRERSTVCRDLTLAATLKRVGSRPGTGTTWRAHRVAWVRSPDRLPHGAQGHDWLTRTQAAQQWGGSATVVTRGLAHGTFPARHVVPSAPWIIQRTAGALPAVHAVVQSGRPGRYQVGLRLGQPEWPGHACPQAGAEQGVAAPGEPHSLTRRPGAQSWLPGGAPDSRRGCCGGEPPMSRGPVA
jgi:hypothetical protein